MKPIIEYDFAKDFNPYPGPRDESIGPHSGEKFKDEVLKKFFEEGQPILLNIDNTKVSFGPSFLSESFGLFAKEITLEKFNELVKVKEDTPKGKKFKKKMMEYIQYELNNDQ
ncbi:MAG: STAS-like domain-containing protein [Sulfurospirillum sp.]|nr:STAS-like domain-containing protein [Sulfurospirillum sp.]